MPILIFSPVQIIMRHPIDFKTLICFKSYLSEVRSKNSFRIHRYFQKPVLLYSCPVIFLQRSNMFKHVFESKYLAIGTNSSCPKSSNFLSDKIALTNSHLAFLAEFDEFDSFKIARFKCKTHAMMFLGTAVAWREKNL